MYFLKLVCLDYVSDVFGNSCSDTDVKKLSKSFIETIYSDLLRIFICLLLSFNVLL